MQIPRYASKCSDFPGSCKPWELQKKSIKKIQNAEPETDVKILEFSVKKKEKSQGWKCPDGRSPIISPKNDYC